MTRVIALDITFIFKHCILSFSAEMSSLFQNGLAESRHLVSVYARQRGHLPHTNSKATVTSAAQMFHSRSSWSNQAPVTSAVLFLGKQASVLVWTLTFSCRVITVCEENCTNSIPEQLPHVPLNTHSICASPKADPCARWAGLLLFLFTHRALKLG